MGCLIPSGHLDTFQRMTIIRLTDLAGARPPYSRITKLHGRKVKSYELDVACSKLGLQTEDYKKYISI